jgi:hypothetical protein
MGMQMGNCLRWIGRIIKRVCWQIEMPNLFNDDFQDFLRALNKANVKYLLVGGFSVILHGYTRTTGDMDIWVERTEDNYQKLLLAFDIFQMPVFSMTKDNFLSNPDLDVFTFGRQPSAIDVITQLKGLDFAPAYEASVQMVVDDLELKVIQYKDLLKAKEAAGRPRDQNDIIQLKLNHQSKDQ